MSILKRATCWIFGHEWLPNEGFGIDSCGRCGYEDGCGITNSPSVDCSCIHRAERCGGSLFSDGRNRQDDLTFLTCSDCGCCYAAPDRVEVSDGVPEAR